MANLKTKMQDDAKAIFLNTGEFSETITYIPHNGSAKTINAIIVREQLQPGQEDAGRILRDQYEIYISTDADDGVAVVTKGQDAVQFPKIPGGTNSTWMVLDILGVDDGMYHLLVGL